MRPGCKLLYTHTYPLGFLRTWMSHTCTQAPLQMLNYAISIYNFKKVALLLCCCSLLTRFYCFITSLPALSSVFIYWTRSFSHGPRTLWRLSTLSNVSDHLLCIVVLCLYAFFFLYLPIVGFICPLGLITNPNVLTDAFILQFQHNPKAILAPRSYSHTPLCHQHKAHSICNILFKAGCNNDSNLEWSSLASIWGMWVLWAPDLGYCFWLCFLKLWYTELRPL